MPRYVNLFCLLGLVALSSCGNNSTVPVALTQLKGVVTQGRAQEAVAGAQVLVEGEGQGRTATTGAEGQFSVPVRADKAMATVTVSKSGYTSSSVQNIDVSKTPALDVILRPVYDPALPATAPVVTIDTLKDGDTVGGQDLTVKLKVTVADPVHNTLKDAIASLEVPAGTSGSMNAGRVRTTFGNPRTSDQTFTFAQRDLAAFKGDVDLHVVVYDLNGNRTDVIRHIKVNSPENAAAVVSPSDLAPRAVTWGDNVTFGPYDAAPQAASSEQAVGPQAAPAGKALWADIDFTYPTASAAPRAFELWRSFDGTTFTKVYSVAPATAVTNKDKGRFRMRDTSGALTPGVKTYYKVRAVSDAGTADSASNDVTPLGAFEVKLLAPAQGTTGADLAPTFRWSATGASDTTFYKVIVLDRVQADGQSRIWLSKDIQDASQATYNFDGAAAQAKLQPYHAYEWELAAYTISKDKKAVAIAADYFNLFGFSPVSSAAAQSGPVAEFLTGGL